MGDIQLDLFNDNIINDGVNLFRNALVDNGIKYENIFFDGTNFEFYFPNNNIVVFICDPLIYNETTISKKYLKILHDKFADIGIKLYIIYDITTIGTSSDFLTRYKNKLIMHIFYNKYNDIHINIAEASGTSRKYYDKYIKYKNKYLELRSKYLNLFW